MEKDSKLTEIKARLLAFMTRCSSFSAEFQMKSFVTILSLIHINKKPHHVPVIHSSFLIMRTKTLHQTSMGVLQTDSDSWIIYMFFLLNSSSSHEHLSLFMSHIHTHITFIFITERALQCVGRETPWTAMVFQVSISRGRRKEAKKKKNREDKSKLFV